ncbi:P-loop containing nucleoside triphosphate hydrolase protein, partial [Cyathus striatus]
FTGQEEYLKKLHEQFDKNDASGRKLYLLYGMGGIGKTQICLKFKDEYHTVHSYIEILTKYYSYSHIFWIDATSENIADQSFKDTYKTYTVDMPSGVSYSPAMVLQWMTNLKTEWLLIFDNADGSPDIVEKFIPPGDKGNILITSRNQEHKRNVSPENSSEVVVMSEDTAVELLFKASGLKKNHDKYFEVAANICGELYYLPLAIDQAGAYISAGNCSINKYISVYSKYRSKLMTNKNFRGASKYNKTVYGTWEISFEKILEMANNKEFAKTANYAITLINICAFMHHENISDEIFERAAKYYSVHVKHNKDCVHPVFLPSMDTALLNFDESNNWNEIQYRESVNVLLSFSLITRTIDGEKFGLHPLVQSWCKDQLVFKDRDTWNWNTRGILLSSVTYKDDSIEYIYQNSIQLHLMSTRILGNEHPHTLKSMANLACTYVELGKYMEAEMLEIQVLEMRTRILGKEHPHTLRSMANLAWTQGNLGKFIEAEILEIQVLEMRTRILGKEHPDTLTSMANLALTQGNLGKFMEAEMLEIQVLEMSTRILRKEHPDTLTSMANLALAQGNLGKFMEAEILEIQVLEMRTRILGKEHPDTLTSMANLACTYGEIGKYMKAEMLEIQVLEMRTRILEKEHPDTLRSMVNMAWTQGNLGKFMEAEILEIQVLEMRTSIKESV